MVRTSDFKIDLKLLKKVNKLMNKRHENTEYTDTFQPSFNDSFIRMCRYWLQLVRVNNLFLLMDSKTSPYMVCSPFKIDGSFPTEDDFLTSLLYIDNIISEGVKNNKFKTRRRVIESIPRQYITNYHNLSYIKHIPQTSEYIFDIHEQVNLTGGKFKRTRNMISGFKRHYKSSIVDLKEINMLQHIDEMIELSKTNIEHVFKDYTLREILLNYTHITAISKGVDGFAIIDDTTEKIIGYYISQRVRHSETKIGNFKRTSHDYKGLSHYIEYIAAQRLLDKYPDLKYINNGPNVRGDKGHFKRSMHPIYFNKISSLELTI